MMNPLSLHVQLMLGGVRTAANWVSLGGVRTAANWVSLWAAASQ